MTHTATIYIAVSAHEFTLKPYLVRLNVLNDSETVITYDSHELDHEFAASSQSEQIVFKSARVESTGVGLYLLQPETSAVRFLSNVSYHEGGDPQWASASQEVWFIDVDRNGWYIASVEVSDPENRIRQIAGDGVIYSFALRNSDRQVALVGDHLMSVDPLSDFWSGINVFDQNGGMVLQTGIRARDVLYHGNDLYYTLFDRFTGLSSISRLNTESGQTDLIFETMCRLWW